jgi:hypothetical protein
MSHNDNFFGEAFRFDVWVRLKDQYKNECGQCIDYFIWGAFKICPTSTWVITGRTKLNVNTVLHRPIELKC